MADRTLRIITETGGNAKAGIDSLANSTDNLKKSASGASSGLKDLAGDLGLPISPAALATAGIAAVGAAVVTSVNAAREGRAVQAQLAAVLESTAHAAGISQEELNKHAEALQRVTNYDDEAIGGAQALLLTFTKIGGDVMPQATKVILDMSTALGQDLKSSSIQVGKALNDPIKGVTALSRVGVSFTADQKEMISTLVESGDILGAQTIILQELQTEFGGSAEAAREADGGFIALSNSVGNLSEAAGDLILGINDGTGAVSGLIDMVDNLTATVTEAGEAIRSGPVGALEALGAIANPLTPIMAALGMDIFPSMTAASVEAAEAINTQAEAHTTAAAAAEEQASASSALSLSQMEALSELSQLEETYNENREALLQKRLDTETAAAESQAENYRTMNEKLNEIDLNRGKQTDEQIAAKKAKVIAGYNEENAEIKAALDKRQADIDAQIAKEKAQHEEKAAEIKRLMALQTLEQSGQLEELTGIAGITAQQYMDAVAAGAISANKEVETQAAATEKSFEGSQKKVAQIVRENQALIKRLHGETSDSTIRDSNRSTSVVVSDFERQAQAAYRANMASREGARSGTFSTGRGYASGGSFKVPPGYPNDSFPMRVSSGEMVTVIPASQAGAGPGFARGTGVPAGWKLDETGLGYVPPDYEPGSTWNGSRWIPPAKTVRGNYGAASSLEGRIAASRAATDLGTTRAKVPAGADWAALARSQKAMAARLAPASSAPSLSTGSGGSSSSLVSGSSGGQPLIININYHPAVSLADQRQLIEVLKGAVREINRLDKVVTA